MSPDMSLEILRKEINNADPDEKAPHEPAPPDPVENTDLEDEPALHVEVRLSDISEDSSREIFRIKSIGENF